MCLSIIAFVVCRYGGGGGGKTYVKIIFSAKIVWTSLLTLLKISVGVNNVMVLNNDLTLTECKLICIVQHS